MPKGKDGATLLPFMIGLVKELDTCANKQQGLVEGWPKGMKIKD